ncbi:hypothetical protein HG530_004410 [Fusarium avenaceum]|nr:hypothetical protein HG530_004410 [Fusarium avenaceum]
MHLKYLLIVQLPTLSFADGSVHDGQAAGDRLDASSLVVGVVLSLDNKDVDEDNNNDNNNDSNWILADPLLLACLAGSVDSNSNLLVTLVKVLDDFLALLLDLSNSGLLLNDECVHVLEQLGQLDHLLLNLDKSLVTVLNSAQGSTSTTLAVALHHGLAEDLTTSGVLNSSLNLLLRSVGAHNTVLASHLVLGSLSELRLNLLVLSNGGLEAAVNTERHGVSGKRVKLTAGSAGARAVGVIESSLLDHTELLEVLLNSVDSAVNVATFVKNSVGVLAKTAGVVSERGHLDAAYPSNHVTLCSGRAVVATTVAVTSVVGVAALTTVALIRGVVGILSAVSVISQ